jgi:hypothetical protein
MSDELSDAASHAARNGEASDLRAEYIFAADLAVYEAAYATADELAKIEKQARCRNLTK